ncbi:hypothetical protein HD554DRAFT_2102686 [Boletus coccyginus]|nr:hypothetical protein HD554DRAFT_2102686 [Boletus coccyginus]
MHPLTFFLASLFTLVASSPLRDISLQTSQLTSGSTGAQLQECQGYGTICDWPIGTKGPCCPPLLCVPLSMHDTPYLVCA